MPVQHFVNPGQLVQAVGPNMHTQTKTRTTRVTLNLDLLAYDLDIQYASRGCQAGPDLGWGPWGPRAPGPPTNRGPPTNSIQVNQLPKIAPRMHQNSPVWAQKSKDLSPRGEGNTPSPHPTPSAPSAPRSSRLRRSTSASGATATGLMGS